MRSVVAMAYEAKEQEKAVAPRNDADTELEPPKRKEGERDDAPASKKTRPNRPCVVPEEDRTRADFANGGQWHYFPHADCARGLNAGKVFVETTNTKHHKSVESAKSKCQENGWAGFSVAKQWCTIYFKYFAHRLQCDWKWPNPQDPENSVDTYMWLTEEEAEIWKERKKEYQEWREKNQVEKYENFQEGASWDCDLRRMPKYNPPKDS